MLLASFAKLTHGRSMGGARSLAVWVGQSQEHPETGQVATGHIRGTWRHVGKLGRDGGGRAEGKGSPLAPPMGKQLEMMVHCFGTTIADY